MVNSFTPQYLQSQRKPPTPHLQGREGFTVLAPHRGQSHRLNTAFFESLRSTSLLSANSKRKIAPVFMVRLKTAPASRLAKIAALSSDQGTPITGRHEADGHQKSQECRPGFLCSEGGTRTHNMTILSRPPLPIGPPRRMRFGNPDVYSGMQFCSHILGASGEKVNA